MSDLIGNITVPDPVVTTTPFPLSISFPYDMTRDWQVVVHPFGSANAKIEQRFLLGTGARKWNIQRPIMSDTERVALRDFWEAQQGAVAQFPFNAPSDNGLSTVAYTARFENQPLSLQMLSDWISSTGVVLVEVPTSSPTYALNSTSLRFPASGLQAALLAQVQEVIPLVKIRPLEVGYPSIYVSDRRCTVGGQLYLPRLLTWGGITQVIGSESDTASFDLGNADRSMAALANQTNLKYAELEFSWFHVGSGIKLDLWKGEIVNFRIDSSEKFQITAADFLPLNLMYPDRNIDRRCWKPFNDGQACPFATQGALDLVHFPSASGTVCDRGLDTDNGCRAHTMLRYYGGVAAEPQGVLVRDNTVTGKPTVTASSLVNDSAWGKPIQQCYTDDPFYLSCQIIDGRKEGEFYDALGIACEGPVIFGSGHSLDGSLHHGYPGPLGLRTVPGNDPAGAADFLSLGQSGDQTGGDYRKAFSGNSTYLNSFAAGVAFIELRRAFGGTELTTPSQHAMTAVIARGLQGWAWTAPGSRSRVTLTNPIWIVINAYLDSRGLRFADAATAEQFFDVDAAVTAAGYADTVVAKLYGTGTEPQFKFRGVIQESHPLRDYLTDILTPALCYYTMAFGRLRVGCRINASATEPFTIGNILMDSLQLDPIEAEFNRMSAEIADEEYLYQKNQVTVADDSYALYISKGLAPVWRDKTINLFGCSSKSRSARVITTLMRENMGGVNVAEWTAARAYSYRTTILALNVEPGTVASMTHSDVPGGVGKFRCEQVRFNPDWSVDVTGRTVTDSMYDYTVGPKPTDIPAAPLPIERFAYPNAPAWMPAQIRANGADPSYAFTDFFLGVQEQYATTTDSSVQAEIVVTGLAPITEFEDAPPPSVRVINTSTGGGSIGAGQDWFLQVAPYRTNGSGDQVFGPPSNVVAIVTGAGSTNSITLDQITWPVGSWDGFSVLAGETEQEICEQFNIVGAPGAGPYSIFNPLHTFAGGIQPNAGKIVAKIKYVVASGLIQLKISSLDSSSITCDGLAGGADTFSGRFLSVISDVSGGQPAQRNYTITAYDQSTGKFTLGQDPTALSVQPGDVFVVRTSPTATANSVTDTLWTNSQRPTGFAADELAGQAVHIIRGTGRGQAPKVISGNSVNTISLASNWDVVPDSSSWIVIANINWTFQSETSAAGTATGKRLEIPVSIDNMQDIMLLVGGFGVDKNGNESPENTVPLREVWVFGQDFFVTVNTNAYTMIPNARRFHVDASTHTPVITLLQAKKARGRELTVARIAGTNAITVAAHAGEMISGTATVTVDQASVLVSDGITWRATALSGGIGTGVSTPGLLTAIGGQPFLITVAATPADGNGIRRQRFSIEYDPPTPVSPFQGVAGDLKTPDGRTTALGNFEYNGNPAGVGSARHGTFTVDLDLAATGAETWIFFLSPYSTSVRIPLDQTTTAHRSITALSSAAGPQGVEWANQVTGFAITTEYLYQPLLPGWKWRFLGTWTNPSDLRYAGTKYVIRPFPAPTPVDKDDRVPSFQGPVIASLATDWWDLADPITTWDNFLPSVDVLGRENAINITNSTLPAVLCPTARVVVSEALALASLGMTKGFGREFASLVTSFAVMPNYVWDPSQNVWTYYLAISWVNPTADLRFEGIEFRYQAAGTADITTEIRYETAIAVPAGTQTLNWGLGDFWSVPPSPVAFNLLARSFDWSDNLNSINTSTSTPPAALTPLVSSTVNSGPAVVFVTSPHVSAAYSPDGGTLIVDTYFTPPATDPSFWYCEVWMVTGPSGSPRWSGEIGEALGLIATPDRFLIPGAFPTTSTENWSFYFVSVGHDQRKNPAAFNPAAPGATPSVVVAVTVPPAPSTLLPALPSSVVGSETGLRGQDATSNQLEVQLRATITYPGGSTATGVHIDVSDNGGATWQDGVNDVASATVDFYWPAPAADNPNFKLRVYTFSGGGWNSPSAAIISAAFTVHAGAVVPTGSITNAVQIGVITYATNTDGQTFWGFKIGWTNPSTPDFLLTKIFAQKVDSGGTPATDYEGQLRDVDERNGAGAICTKTIDDNWTIPPSSSGFHYRIFLYCVNQQFQENLQTTAWSGASFLTLTPVEPVGGAGLERCAVVTAFTAVVHYGNDETGSQTWRLDGSVTAPTDPRYGGCQIFAGSGATGKYSLMADIVTGQYGSVTFPVPVVPEAYSFWAVSYDTSGRSNNIVFLTTPSVGPVTVSRDGGASPTLGQEFCPLVTGFSLLTITGIFGEDGAQQFYFTGNVSAPVDPRYKGCVIRAGFRCTLSIVAGATTAIRMAGPAFQAQHIGERLNVSGLTITITAVSDADHISFTPAWGSSTSTGWVAIFVDEMRQVADIPIPAAGSAATPYTGDHWDVLSASADWAVFFISYDMANRENSLVPGITPQLNSTVGRVGGSSGQEYAAVVTNILPESTIFGNNVLIITSDLGETVWFTGGLFTEPNDPRYGGCKIVRVNGSDPMKSIEMADVPKGVGKWRSDFQFPGATVLTIAFLSYDTSNRQNTYVSGLTPTFLATTPAQDITLNLAKVLPASLTTSAFASTIRPVALFSSSPGLPSSLYPPGSMGYNTSTFSLLKVDPGGTFWQPAVNGSTDVISNSITAGQIAAGAISTSQLFAGEILVGGGGGKPTRFRVNDGFGSMVGFIGDNGSGFIGSYFVNMRIGTNINDPAFYADASQVYLKNVPLTLQNINGLYTLINNTFFFDQVYSLISYSSGTADPVLIRPGMIQFLASGAGTTRIILQCGGGTVANFQLHDVGATQKIRMHSGVPGGTAITQVHDGSSNHFTFNGAFNYTKPGGASGTITVVAGWIVSVT